uniref:MRN complex-interacting protein N-terminal domain-containing protein n=1 Tax=Anopheles funestus TaxID=62324 RepID=A0A453YNI1_ANOFN
MPQELRVVRCFQCLKYQVDIVKKANKWVCKLCGVKQSLAREFFRGSGKDCRSMVQQLSIRNLEIDQQEAEVASLVLQNKIQLPTRPVETVPTSTITEKNEALQGPSKWETFLTKETDDDLSDVIGSSESFESVSSTTFDRERINNPETKFGPKRTRGWNYHRMNSEDLYNSKERQSSSIGKYSNPSSKNMSSIEQKKPRFNSIRSTHKEQFGTFPNASCTDKRSYSAGNDSTALPSFHRNENNSRQTVSNHTKKIFPKVSVAQKSSTIDAPSSSASSNPPEMVCKRRKADVFATPLMNFGKRSDDGSKITLPTSSESLENANDMKSTSNPKPTSVSSKWAKYLQEDDITNENTNNLIMF